jgi:ferrochelatase
MSEAKSKTGILLINVGSPDNTSRAAVARYLTQFLMDPDIIDLPWIFRTLLVRGIIVPGRAGASAEKYQQIWLKEGSPLVVLSQKFTHRLREVLGPEFHIELGMRCGNPSVKEALDRLVMAGVKEIQVAPLFPQAAAATTGGSFKEVEKILKSKSIKIPVKKLKPFYQNAEFVSAFAKQIQNQKPHEYDHILFSFHGLPEKQIKKGEGCLSRPDCCLRPSDSQCYRYQCVQTAQKIADQLDLSPERWSYSFQSRLGRTQWIQPYTDSVVRDLAQQGKKKVLTVCPSFVTDCLETLEEIGITLKNDFLAVGGTQLTLAPCPNDSDLWVQGFSKILLQGLD